LELHLDGLQVVVIGGTNGIGYAIAKGFLTEGSTVHIISRNSNKEITDELTLAFNRRVFFYNCDAADAEALALISKDINGNTGGKIDIVNSNVGNGRGSATPVPPRKEWDLSWNTNFISALNAVGIFSENLIENNGSLIFISSIAGMEFLGAPVVYSTAKSALISFAKSLSHKLAPKVRVNVVSPGNVWVKNGTWDIKMKENPEKVQNMLNEKVPLKRFGLPAEVSDLVLFLSSTKASFITGGCFVIDGGQTTSF